MRTVANDEQLFEFLRGQLCRFLPHLLRSWLSLAAAADVCYRPFILSALRNSTMSGVPAETAKGRGRVESFDGIDIVAAPRELAERGVFFIF